MSKLFGFIPITLCEFPIYVYSHFFFVWKLFSSSIWRISAHFIVVITAVDIYTSFCNFIRSVISAVYKNATRCACVYLHFSKNCVCLYSSYSLFTGTKFVFFSFAFAVINCSFVCEIKFFTDVIFICIILYSFFLFVSPFDNSLLFFY